MKPEIAQKISPEIAQELCKEIEYIYELLDSSVEKSAFFYIGKLVEQLSNRARDT